MHISFVVAIADNGVIGRDGGLPWRIAADMAHFRNVTMGRPIIMGRKTWDSLPKKPLPGRRNIVVTRSANFRAEGASIATSAEKAVAIARRVAGGASEICVIGGAEIYRALLPEATRIYLTEVHANIEGDATFSFDRTEWREISREAHPQGEKDTAAYSFVLLERTAQR